MKNFLLYYSFHINVIIISLIIYYCPAYAETGFQKDISSFIDNYLLGNIGLSSDNRPFMSKIIGNYVALNSILLGIVLYFFKVIPHKNNQESPPCYLLGMAFIILICFYFTFFSNVIFKVPQKSYINILPDSLIMYGLVVIACFFMSTIGISMILYFLGKTKSFIELIK
ncbi:hypothetical protein ACWIUA_02390 [Ursidibacter sp. B-7004-1]